MSLAHKYYREYEEMQVECFLELYFEKLLGLQSESLPPSLQRTSLPSYCTQ